MSPVPRLTWLPPKIHMVALGLRGADSGKSDDQRGRGDSRAMETERKRRKKKERERQEEEWNTGGIMK